jgi:hypothetical protein
MATYHVRGQQVTKRQRAVLCCSFFVLWVPPMTFAQDAAAQADAAYQAKNWSEATKLYNDLAAANPQRSKDGGKTWNVEYDFTYLRKVTSYK